MSIAERKEREKEEMHKLILDSARNIFLEKGYDHASIRNIAEQMNYSPGTIYFYFKDKAEIFRELHEEGFRLLLGKLKVLEHVGDPFERLKAIGYIFIDFALHNKDYYNLMFIMDVRIDKIAGNWEMGNKTLDRLKSVLRECQEKGRFTGLDLEYLSFAVLSSIHGICALFCKSRTLTYPGRTNEELMIGGYKNIILMWEKM